MINRFTRGAAACAAVLTLLAGAASASDDIYDYDSDDEPGDFAYGSPSVPSEAWTLAAGGRIYDKWWAALDRPEPVYFTHPAYPADGSKSGADTWRCVTCHGWDYKGATGIFRSGDDYTGIKGIDGAAGRDEGEIVALLRAPLHGYTREMIDDDAMARLAAFVARGQIDMSKYVDLATREIIAGDIDRGRAVFQTNCAACHGFDGRQLNWGGPGEDAFIGTEAASLPDEVMNKMLNAHPGVWMINLRAFGPDLAADVLRYASTLPQD